MNLQTYDPKTLLTQLITIEKNLSVAIESHFSEPELTVSEDLDKAFSTFFQSKELEGNEVGYLSTQLALLHLKREVEKTIDVLVESNQLRAYYDFISSREVSDIEEKEGKNNRQLFVWGAIFGGILIGVIFLFYLI